MEQQIAPSPQPAAEAAALPWEADVAPMTPRAPATSRASVRVIRRHAAPRPEPLGWGIVALTALTAAFILLGTRAGTVPHPQELPHAVGIVGEG